MAGHDLSFDSDTNVQLLCDDGAGLAPFLRRFTYELGALVSTADTTLDGSTAYVLVGNAVSCGGNTDVEKQILCDDDGAGTITKFIRYAVVNTSTGAVASVFDTDLAGAAYVTSGTVGACGDSSSIQAKVLCDDDGAGTSVRFIRHFVYSDVNTIASNFDTDLAGAAYVVAGTAVDCDAASTADVAPVVTDQAADGTHTTVAGVASISVTNMTSTGTVSIAGTNIPVGFSWTAEAQNGKGLAAVAVVVAGGGRAIITEVPA